MLNVPGHYYLQISRRIGWTDSGETELDLVAPTADQVAQRVAELRSHYAEGNAVVAELGCLRDPLFARAQKATDSGSAGSVRDSHAEGDERLEKPCRRIRQ